MAVKNLHLVEIGFGFLVFGVREKGPGVGTDLVGERRSPNHG